MARPKRTKNEIHWEAKAKQYRDYSNNLKRDLQNAHNLIRDIAAGLVSTPIAPETWPTDLKLRYTAADFLRRMAGFNNKEPEGMFYP